MPHFNYEPLLTSHFKEQWKKISTRRRAGVAVPLFSIHSYKSIGIGEISDLSLLLDWSKSAGLSMIQLLPLNDVGYRFRPYDAESTFALDPMYLCMDDILGVTPSSFENEINALRKAYPTTSGRVQYSIKEAKMELLRKMFMSRDWKKYRALNQFIQNNDSWINDYSLFKSIKEKNKQKQWTDWDEPLKRKDSGAIHRFERQNKTLILFHKWIQFQLYNQFIKIKRKAKKDNILLAGDIPFLVSRDSADVWSNQNYFKLNFFTGAPADRYYANGQRWEMPPYDWDNISRNNYHYLKERLKFAENFYDLFRIDHSVGLFRIWSIPVTEPAETEGLNGSFDPKDESVWESHGKKIMDVMVKSTSMLPCAEDLGTVPECSYRVLEEYGIPGTEIQRWKKDWGQTNKFIDPEYYRVNSISMLSTHDTSSLKGWWEFEAGTVDKTIFERKCSENGLSYDKISPSLVNFSRSKHDRLRWNNKIESENHLLKALSLSEYDSRDFLELYHSSFREKEKFWNYIGLEGSLSEEPTDQLAFKSFEKILDSRSIFSVQMLHDWYGLEKSPMEDHWNYRINIPGIISDQNWSIQFPLSLEEMIKSDVVKNIKQLVQNSDRMLKIMPSKKRKASSK